MKKNILTGLIVLLLLGAGAAFYVWKFVYNKKHKDIEAANPDFTTSTAELIAEFEANDTLANSKYNEKVVLMSGKVNSILPGDSISSIIIDEEKALTITIEFLPSHNDRIKQLQPGAEVRMQALYVGYVYDALLAGFGEKGDIKFKKGSIKD